MSNRYVNHWGKIKQIKIPNAIIQDGTITIPSGALAVWLVLLQIAKNKPLKLEDLIATVKVGHERLIERTGYSKNAVTKAIKGLKEKKLVEPATHRKRRGEFGVNEYTLCDPENGEPLTAKRDVVYGNGLPYFTFPECVITEHTANWSLAKMSSAELSLYTSILYLASRKRSNEVDSTAAELCKLSGLVAHTFRKALDGLESRGLIWFIRLPKAYRISLCDPYTGQPLEEFDGDDESDPTNYYSVGSQGRATRVDLNSGDPEQIEKLIRESAEGVIKQGNGDLMIRCPFHSDSNPSCSVSPRKNGCFYCFGCEEKGNLTSLLAKLRDISKGEAIMQTATALGQKVEYHQPDANVMVKYQYRNQKSTLLKQVLRYPDEDGHKVFSQRRPGKGGWIWNTSGLKPMLFNADLMFQSTIVCITEGEKDAVRVTDLHLDTPRGRITGITSGGAESWDPALAKGLRNYRVILMPDADAAGEKFAASVKASLEAEEIEYRVVSFGDVGCKDVSEFLDAGHTVEELVQRIGTDWVDGVPVSVPEGECWLSEEIVI